MKTSLHALLIALFLILGQTSAFSGEKGGNTGSTERLEVAVDFYKVSMMCPIIDYDTWVPGNYCEDALEYVNSHQCSKNDFVSGCDFQKEVVGLINNCCVQYVR